MANVDIYYRAEQGDVSYKPETFAFLQENADTINRLPKNALMPLAIECWR